MNQVTLAFLFTLIAGLSTGIGSCIAFFAKKTNTKFLSVSLGFSAGVMIYVSMIELFGEAEASLSAAYGGKSGLLYTIIAFFGGMLIIGIIDRLIPGAENPHETKSVERMNRPPERDGLMRTGLLTALAIAVHNFPEGLATFVSSLREAKVAIPVVAAIALHNIPEGIAVSVPIYYATGNRKKAFWYSFASGLSEPLGAAIGYLILMPFLNDTLYGILYAAVAGIMVFISLDELLPSAQEYGEHHLSMYGLVGGMAVMALSLWVFV